MTAEIPVARAFLAALDPDGTDFTFQVFAERPQATIRPEHLDGELVALAKTLSAINARGGGIFVTVNRTDGRGRTAANIVALRSVFIDCDRPRIRALALAPSISVETRPGRGHHYWLLTGDQPVERFTGIQQQLAAYYGSDAAVTDLPRVLRVPGFWNVKEDPFLVRLVRCRPDLRYTLDDIVRAHGFSSADQASVPPAAAPSTVADRLYRRWALRAPITVGSRNRVAFRLALEGFRAGLDDRVVEQEVRAFCDRCGIAAEALRVLRDARKASRRRFRHSSRSGSDDGGESSAAK